LIDSVFHSQRAAPITVDTTNPNMVVNGAPPLPKEDPLSNYVPTPVAIVTPAVLPHDDPLTQFPATGDITIDDRIVATPISHVEAVPADAVPDWLKVPAAQEIATSSAVIPIVPPVQTIESMSPLFEVATPSPFIENTSIQPETTVATDDSIPDWIKSTPSVVEAENVLSNLSDTLGSASIAEKLNPPVSEELPDWLMSSLQSDSTPPDTLASVTIDPIVPVPETLIQ
jgi:hypothetical protein